jgi:hypothetical protein
MRACEGCRRRKIKCDAATTNTWPCSACIRLKLHCVRPNGYDGAADSFEPPMGQPDQFHEMSMQQPVMQATGPKPPGQPVYPPQGSYPDAAAAAGYQTIPHNSSQPHQPDLNYASVPPPMSAMDAPYAAQGVFPTPPLQPQSSQHEPSPEAYTPDSYAQQDLSELLGNLKVDEKGTGMHGRRCVGSAFVPTLLTACDLQRRIFATRHPSDGRRNLLSKTMTSPRCCPRSQRDQAPRSAFLPI